MSSDPDRLPDRDEEVCEVLAAYFEAHKAGLAPEREAWLARHPEIASWTLSSSRRTGSCG